MSIVSPWKAETIMGRAFRDAFDKETFYALLKHAAEWKRCEQMVRCQLGNDGSMMFYVRLAKKGPGLHDDIVVSATMTGPQFAVAAPEAFEDAGKQMAVRANAAIEDAYMKVPGNE